LNKEEKCEQNKVVFITDDEEGNMVILDEAPENQYYQRMVALVDKEGRIFDLKEEENKTYIGAGAERMRKLAEEMKNTDLKKGVCIYTDDIDQNYTPS